MAKRGRRTKYTPETVAKIVQAIELGATFKLACQYAGINADTFYDWMNKHSDFSDKVKSAEGKSAVVALAQIKKAANEGNWAAGAWLLERRHNYIRKTETAITVPPEVIKKLEEKGIGLDDVWLAMMQEVDHVDSD